MTETRAISLTQPWAWVILNLGKRIENRDWVTHFRGRLLLHAAKGMTVADWYAAHDFVAAFDAEAAARIPKPKDPALVRGALVGRAELVDVVSPGWKFASRRRPRDNWTEQQKRWYMGAYGFVLAHVRPTNVVPCKGALGLWVPGSELIQQAFAA